MGVKNLKKLLPITHIHDVYEMFKSCLIVIDVAHLMIKCAFEESGQFVVGNYIPALKRFQRQLLYMKSRKIKFHLVFDGCSRPEKKQEAERRESKRNKCREDLALKQEKNEIINNTDWRPLVTNTSLYIAMCTKICDIEGISFVVAPFEADSQVVGEDNIVVSGDSDMLVLGVKKWVVIDDWVTGEGHMIDVTTFHESQRLKFPLVGYYLTHGVVVFEMAAAVFGCDYSVKASGICGVGPATFFKALENLNSNLNEASISIYLANALNNPTAEPAISTEIRKVIQVYRSSLRYDSRGVVVSLNGHTEDKAQPSFNTVLHMQGKLDPKTGDGFNQSDTKVLKEFNPAQLIHFVALRPEDVPGAILPEGRSPNECDVVQLRSFLATRGARSSALSKDQLITNVTNFLEMEKTVPAIIVDSYDSGGLNLKFVTSNHAIHPKQFISDLVKKHTGVKDDICLHGFLVDIAKFYEDKEVSESFEDIVLYGPELDERVIHLLYASFGGGEEKKSLRESFQKMADQNELIYHANVIQPDRLFIVSKQPASLRRDETTRKTVELGNKPLPTEYLVLIELFVDETTVESHGHNLGLVKEIGRHWCECAAGRGECVHLGMAIWTQLHHWGPNRPGDMPPTSKLCSWCVGSKKRCNDVSRGIAGISYTVSQHDKPNKHFRTVQESTRGAYFSPFANEADEALFNEGLGGKKGRHALTVFVEKLMKNGGAKQEKELLEVGESEEMD